jgi:SpoVK/Ycf46/Vps4 family AAA+-type ATPase
MRRASDVLSSYVGQTERRIAAMFEEAQDEGAVLLLDEVDSLLQDRQGATRSWEVTQVNEMLTQMEDFEGVFIASTNLVESLDAAALRRFDSHVRLGYLRSEQAVGMFVELAAGMQLEPDQNTLHSLIRLDRLTPGDFAAVWRMCRLARPSDAAELAARLRRACDDKKDGRQRAIGFAT